MVSTVFPSISHEVMGPDAMILVLWMLSFKPTFSLSSLTFIKRLFSSSSLSVIRVVSSAYLGLLIFLPVILIPACASSSPAFLMMYSAYKLSKQGDKIQPWCTPFPIWKQSVVPYPVLTVASCSVSQSCPTLCDPMNCSTPGLPVHHQLPESTQTHVHWVSDAIQPSLPLLLSSPPALNHSQHQGLFKWVSSSHLTGTIRYAFFSLTSWEDYRSIFTIFNKKFAKSQNWSYVILDKWKLIIKEKLSLNLVKQNYFYPSFHT